MFGFTRGSSLQFPLALETKRPDRALRITCPDETEVDVQARGTWNQSLSLSWTPEKEHPAAGRTLPPGVESTSFGFVGRLLIALTSLLTVLLIERFIMTLAADGKRQR